MEGEDTPGERITFDVFVGEDDDLQILKLAFLLKKMF